MQPFHVIRNCKHLNATKLGTLAKLTESFSYCIEVLIDFCEQKSYATQFFHSSFGRACQFHKASTTSIVFFPIEKNIKTCFPWMLMFHNALSQEIIIYLFSYLTHLKCF